MKIPKGTTLLAGALALAGAAALAQGPVKIAITSEVVRENFRGVGFHGQLFLESSTPEYWDQVIAKRWRELNPGFARVFHNWARGRPGVRDPRALDFLACEIVFMKESAGTEVYLTTSAPKDVPAGQERAAYARAVAGEIEYILRKGGTNLKFYGSSNELTLREWGDLNRDLPTYRDYHRHLYAEFRKRNLPVKLLATDASPVSYWNSLQWAADNMDDITDVYGGHHYATRQPADDLEFYSWFLERCTWAVGLARSRKKDFILGEFGPGQYQETRWGLRWDTPEAFGTPMEAQAGLQTAEAAMAAVNAGVYAMGYWTFTDYPDRPGHAINQWGLFKSMSAGAVTRAPYYCYGLLTKFFRGPARVYRVTSGEAKVHAAAVERDSDKAWSIAVINRETHPVAVTVALAIDPGKPFRKYLYDTAHVPVTEDGDLQEPSGKLAARDRELNDTVPANSMALYTTAYDDDPPAPVRGLEVKAVDASFSPRDAKRLTWKANTEPDLCYYRIYHNNVRVGSTVSTEYIVAGPERWRSGPYTVVAVDTSGNAGR
jgi:hypothetical protein